MTVLSGEEKVKQYYDFTQATIDTTEIVVTDVTGTSVSSVSNNTVQIDLGRNEESLITLKQDLRLMTGKYITIHFGARSKVKAAGYADYHIENTLKYTTSDSIDGTTIKQIKYIAGTASSGGYLSNSYTGGKISLKLLGDTIYYKISLTESSSSFTEYDSTISSVDLDNPVYPQFKLKNEGSDYADANAVNIMLENIFISKYEI